MGRNRGRPQEVVRRDRGQGLPVGWRPSELQPTTRAILRAAHELLVLQGAHSVTMAAVARRAHVDVTTVSYHFGTREGLIEALMDSLYAEPVADLMDSARDLPDVHDRWHAYVRAIRAMNRPDDIPLEATSSGPTPDTQGYFDIAAVALRTPSLRARLADLQGWKVDAFLAELGPDDLADAKTLGEFIFAAVDGIELHHAIAGAKFPLDEALGILERLVDELLD